MKRIVLLLIIILSAFKVNSQSIIEMEYKNGVYYVPCKIKDIPMNFIFDTGASNVSISLTEAMFLLKHGAISTKNIGATTKYQIANGKIQEGTKVIIPSIKVGGFELNNIEAGIVHNMEAPLLLGQSAISKLGKVQLDGNKLIIQKESNKENKFLGININNHFDDFNLGIRFKDYVLKAKKEGSINSSGIIKQSFKVQDLTHKNHSLSFMNFQESIFFHESGYI
ncbi:retropepsin-like aspartic protease family protein, partial [Tenacibaculum maritimum]